jgi:UV DNA damage endonuclease
LSTWPSGVTPKIHFSSPRTELKLASPEASEENSARPPLWSNHSDYINPFEFIDFMKRVGGQDNLDIMLEAKAKDLAVLRLRRDLARFAPDHLGLH